jgi:hypothetical protein
MTAFRIEELKLMTNNMQFSLPNGSKILNAEVNPDNIIIWYQTPITIGNSPSTIMENWVIRQIATGEGHSVTENYLGSFRTNNGIYMSHIFAEKLSCEG